MQACTDLQSSKTLSFLGFIDNRHMKMVRFSGLRTGRLYLPGTPFCQRLNRPRVHSAAGGSKSIKIPMNPLGMEHDLLACSAVHQPFRSPRTPSHPQSEYVNTFRQGEQTLACNPDLMIILRHSFHFRQGTNGVAGKERSYFSQNRRLSLVSFFVGSVQVYFSVKLGFNPSTLKMESACLYETPYLHTKILYANPGDLRANYRGLANLLIYPYNQNQQDVLFIHFI